MTDTGDDDTGASAAPADLHVGEHEKEKEKEKEKEQQHHSHPDPHPPHHVGEDKSSHHHHHHVGEGEAHAKVSAGGGAVGSEEEEEEEKAIEQTKDMTEGSVIKQAYLLKRTHNIKHSWHKRWFVLRKERLNIYEDEREYELLKFIKLKESRLLERTTRNREHTFAIVCGMKTLYLQAPSDEERTVWIEALISAGITPPRDHPPNELLLATQSPENGSNGSLNTPNTPSVTPGGGRRLEDDKSPKARLKSADSPRVYFSDDNENENTSESEGELTNPLEKVLAEGVIKQGYLLKQTVVRKKWKRRWVVLRENGRLMYYKNDQEYEVLKVIRITRGLDFALTPLEKHKRPFGFQISTPKRTFYFIAASEDDCKSWVETLTQERVKMATLSHDDEDLPSQRKFSSEGALPTPVTPAQ